jgi:2-polyprenyl-3-methyl-5-hydroxy-6-metoxy-1,4-benzoquinol methylase
LLTFSQKINYLLDSTLRYFEAVKCPYCSSGKHILIDRKYIVTRLFECEDCHLYFRHPQERIIQNKIFYQTDYKEKDNITAFLPDKIELETLINNDFQKGNKNAGRYVRLFRSLFPGEQKLKIIDYGCSWGYITFQLAKAGFDMQGYEISKARVAYGNSNLGVDIKDRENELRKGNDLFFSAHVIEHHPDIKGMISLAKKLVTPDGYFVAISPNGSEEYRSRNNSSFHHAWGKVHPNYLNAGFYKTIFKNHPYFIGCSPFDFGRIRTWGNNQIIDKTDGEELILIAKPNRII